MIEKNIRKRGNIFSLTFCFLFFLFLFSLTFVSAAYSYNSGKSSSGYLYSNAPPATGGGSNTTNYYNITGGNSSEPLWTANYTTGILNTTTTNLPSVDWNNNILYGTGNGVNSTPSIDWQDRILYNENGNPSVYWLSDPIAGGESLYSSLGGTAVDWYNGYLHDHNNALSIDWNNRLLYTNEFGSQEEIVANWSNGDLIDPNAQLSSLNWFSRNLMDTNGTISINWDNRSLFDYLGNNILNWSDGNITANNLIFENGTEQVCTAQNGLCSSVGNVSLINNSYYLTSNPFNFYNSTTLPAGGNSSWNQTYANTLYVLTGNASYFTNNTFYPYSLNPLSFYNITTLPAFMTNASIVNYFSNGSYVNTTFLNALGYYNSTNPPPASGVTIGTLQSYLTNASSLNASQFNSTLFTTGTNITIKDLTYYPYSTNPLSFWNSTFATFNKTYADVLYGNATNGTFALISEPKAYNGSLITILALNGYGYYNSTNIPLYMLITTAQSYFTNGTNVNGTQFNSTQFNVVGTNVTIKDAYVTGLASGVSIGTLQNYFANGTNINLTNLNSIFMNGTHVTNATLNTYFLNGTNINMTTLNLYNTNGTYMNLTNLNSIFMNGTLVTNVTLTTYMGNISSSGNASWNQTQIVGAMNINLSSFNFTITNQTGSKLFLINATNGFTGFNTSTPQQTLDVRGTLNVTNLILGSIINTSSTFNHSNFMFGTTTGIGINTSGKTITHTLDVLGQINFTGVGNSSDPFDVYGNSSGASYTLLDMGAINSSGALGGTAANRTYVTVGQLLNITSQGVGNIICTIAYNGTIQRNNTAVYGCSSAGVATKLF